MENIPEDPPALKEQKNNQKILRTALTPQAESMFTSRSRSTHINQKNTFIASNHTKLHHS